MVLDADNVFTFAHDVVERSELLREVFWDAIDVAKLTDGLEELIGRARELGLEEGQPEDLGVDGGGEDAGDLSLKEVVYNIFEVNSVEIVGPWMKGLEALVLELLLSIPVDVGPEEGIGSLVSLDWVAQIVLVDVLLLVSQEGADGLHAGGGLQVLSVDQLLECLVKISGLWCSIYVQLGQNSGEDGLESLKVPVLIDDLMDDSSLEHLMHLVSE